MDEDEATKKLITDGVTVSSSLKNSLNRLNKSEKVRRSMRGFKRPDLKKLTNKNDDDDGPRVHLPKLGAGTQGLFKSPQMKDIHLRSALPGYGSDVDVTEKDPEGAVAKKKVFKRTKGWELRK